MFERGVSYYTRVTAVIKWGFPEDMIRCQWCRYCRDEHGLKRWKCLLTDELLVNPLTCIGNLCPIEIVEDKELKIS